MPQTLSEFFSSLDVVEKLEFTALVSSVGLGAALTYWRDTVFPNSAKPIVIKKIPLSSKLKELPHDSELSPDYLKEIVKQSNNKADLKQIANYIIDKAKTRNLTGHEIGTLKRMIRTKFDNITDKDIMRQMIRTIKEQGTSMVEHLDSLI